MTRFHLAITLCFGLLPVCTQADSQDTPAPPNTQASGSSAFCLYELPENDGKRRWVNLGIVQYVEFSRNELKLNYGGGNLGSGHEAKILIANPQQLEEALNRIRQTAANCR